MRTAKKILLNIAALPVIVIAISSILTVLAAVSLALSVILSVFLAIPFALFFAIAFGLCTLLNHLGLTHGFFSLIALLISWALTSILFGVLSELRDKFSKKFTIWNKGE